MLVRFFEKYELYLLLLIIAVSIIVYTFVGIQKHLHFQTFAWDSAFFFQQLYFLDQFKSPYTSLSDMNALGDHFHLTFVIFGFLFYQFWQDPKVLFLMQAVFVSLSGFFLYLISINLLSKLKLRTFSIKIFSLLLTLMYLYSVSMQALILDEFHNDPLATLPLLALIYFLLKKNNLMFYLSLIFLLMTKETYGLYTQGLAIFIYLLTKDIKKAMITSILGFLSFYLLIYHLMPSLSKTNTYFHFAVGNKPEDVIGEIIKNPTSAITEFIDHPAKIKTILVGLISFGFLPLISAFTFLIMPALSLAIRFYDDSTLLLYQFNNHYSAPLNPILAIASIIALKRAVEFLKRFKLSEKKITAIATLYLITFLILQNIIFHGPLNSILKLSFYEFTTWELNAHELITHVPKNASVASQNSLLPHLAERDNFYLLPKIADAEYIALDLEDGSNKFSPLSFNETKQLVNEMIIKNEFKIVWQKNEALLLKRISESSKD